MYLMYRTEYVPNVPHQNAEYVPSRSKAERRSGNKKNIYSAKIICSAKNIYLAEARLRAVDPCDPSLDR